MDPVGSALFGRIRNCIVTEKTDQGSIKGNQNKGAFLKILEYTYYVVLSRKNRNRIIKYKQIIVGCYVMAHLKGLDNLFLGKKPVHCKVINSETTARQRQQIHATCNQALGWVRLSKKCIGTP